MSTLSVPDNGLGGRAERIQPIESNQYVLNHTEISETRKQPQDLSICLQRHLTAVWLILKRWRAQGNLKSSRFMTNKTPPCILHRLKNVFIVMLWGERCCTCWTWEVFGGLAYTLFQEPQMTIQVKEKFYSYYGVKWEDGEMSYRGYEGRLKSSRTDAVITSELKKYGCSSECVVSNGFDQSWISMSLFTVKFWHQSKPHIWTKPEWKPI